MWSSSAEASTLPSWLCGQWPTFPVPYPESCPSQNGSQAALLLLRPAWTSPGTSQQCSTFPWQNLALAPVLRHQRHLYAAAQEWPAGGARKIQTLQLDRSSGEAQVNSSSFKIHRTKCTVKTAECEVQVSGKPNRIHPVSHQQLVIKHLLPASLDPHIRNS